MKCWGSKEWWVGVCSWLISTIECYLGVSINPVYSINNDMFLQLKILFYKNSVTCLEKKHSIIKTIFISSINQQHQHFLKPLLLAKLYK